MKTVIITDGKYRSALAAARDLGRAGYRVVVTQTRADCAAEPPVFASVFASGRWIEGGVGDLEYPDRLFELIAGLGHGDGEAKDNAEPKEGAEQADAANAAVVSRPVLLCVGAGTLNAVARERERFAAVADFLIAAPEVLDALNDKEAVHARAMELGLPVPREYEGEPEAYPVVIKPHCGEKAGLKAADRYAVARDAAEFREKYEKMKAHDPAPIVQERVEGAGGGVSLLLGRESELLGAICHRRLREYPMSGGPSTCCVTTFDPARIEQAHALLRSFGFVGLAMVEFKGDCILEVNPRIWGSFPLTVFAGSSICRSYALAAAGEAVTGEAADDELGKKMRFCFNDLAASADLLRHGKLKAGCSGLLDFFRVPEALKDREDLAAYRAYLRSYRKRG